MPEQPMQLQSNDGDVKVVQSSEEKKQMLDNLAMTEDDVIPLKMSTALLKKVINSWANHHKDDPPPAEDDEDMESCSDDCSCDSDLSEGEVETLTEMIKATNHVENPGLLDLTCVVVANMIKRDLTDDILEAFNITNDDSPSEEEQENE